MERGLPSGEVYVSVPERKTARRKESSLADEILEFNHDALAVVNGLDVSLGEERKVELRFRKNGQADCEIVFKPIREKRVEGKKGVIEIENEEIKPKTRTFSTDRAGILGEYNVCLELSSNQRFVDTPELGLLTKLTVVEEDSEDNEINPVLDAFVSLRDGIKDERGQFDSYSRPRLTEDQELVFLEVAGLLRAVKESL